MAEEMTLAPGIKLGPYEILSAIGSGGMGEVWKARDTRLSRIVAIKKVGEQHSERFKQEARSIAALNHPNICQIFDIGDNYLVLEYVEGKPLSSPLPGQEAVKLAIQVVTALEAAHKKGIIHRDLKPSNIMVSDEGIVKLLDFGLAKLYEQDQSISNLPTADFPATQAGAILGTVAYMSPEQAQGQPVDARSDIFSFGLVLYEMLSGKRAFSGDSTPETMAALLRDKPAPLKTSPDLEKVVKRCLEKDPSKRYQRMSELKVDLVKAIAKKATVSSEEPQPSIAVLPFVNMSGDKEQEYFSDGLAEEIINALTKIPGLKVAGRTSSFYFRNKDVEFKEIGRKLEVEHILEGSVRKAGNRLRVTAQLIKSEDGFHQWSERYDRDMTDVFSIQDEISEAIAGKLRVELSGERSLVKRPIENIEAYNLYLKGRYYLSKFTIESMTRSKEYFEQAIAKDPDYAIAWYGLATYYWWLGYLGFMPPKETYPQCKQTLIKALKLDDKLADAHSYLAMLLTIEFDWKGAEREFRRAMELNPESADVLANYSQFYLAPRWLFHEALAAAQKALQLDPLSSHKHFHLGHRYHLLQNYTQAIEQFLSAIELNPQGHYAYTFLAYSYIFTGRVEEGVQVAETRARLLERDPHVLNTLGWAYGMAGRTNDAQKQVEELQKLAQKKYVQPSAFAAIYMGLGETDKCLDYLEKSVDQGDSMVNTTVIDPALKSLHSHPRFKALLRKMNLEL
jgi:serine/threonine protein kinase/Tfp pilus assembly protein PilF